MEYLPDSPGRPLVYDVVTERQSVNHDIQHCEQSQRKSTCGAILLKQTKNAAFILVSQSVEGNQQRLAAEFGMRLHTGGILLLTLVVGGCNQSNDGARTIAEAIGPDGHFRSSIPAPQIEATLPKQSDQLQYVNELASLSKRLAQAVHAKAADLPSGASALIVNVYRPDVDQYGNERPNSFVTVYFDIFDLKSAHLDRLDDVGILNLAREVRPIAAYQDDIDAWCKGHSAVSHFCSLAGVRRDGSGP